MKLKNMNTRLNEKMSEYNNPITWKKLIIAKNVKMYCIEKRL